MLSVCLCVVSKVTLTKIQTSLKICLFSVFRNIVFIAYSFGLFVSTKFVCVTVRITHNSSIPVLNDSQRHIIYSICQIRMFVTWTAATCAISFLFYVTVLVLKRQNYYLFVILVRKFLYYEHICCYIRLCSEDIAIGIWFAVLIIPTDHLFLQNDHKYVFISLLFIVSDFFLPILHFYYSRSPHWFIFTATSQWKYQSNCWGV